MDSKERADSRISTIRSSDLKSRVLRNKKPFEYLVSPSAVSLRPEEKAAVLESAVELRRLLRAKDNLRRALQAFDELRRTQKLASPTALACHGLFCLGIALYGACFVKANDGKSPLGRLGNEVIEGPAHKQMRDFRDKLFSHLDENHEVKSDDLDWTLRVDVLGLKPIRPQLSGSFILTPSSAELDSWSSQIVRLLAEIEVRESELTCRVNAVLGIVTILEDV